MRALFLTLLTILPFTANAQTLCGEMTSPPPDLKYVSRGFGHGHTGLDMMAPEGSPVRAAAPGTVVYRGWYFAYGNIVDIQHTDGIVTRYAHMSAFIPSVDVGTKVTAGQEIGKVGHTGRAHGSHVHFEVRIGGRPVDPKPYLALAPCTGGNGIPLIEEAEVPAPRHYRAHRRPQHH
jgi:murein DD-endopeptidase MepM/ murein hydrolase activator NlpD